LFCFLFFFWDKISLCSPLCSPGGPQTFNPPASASWVLRLQVSTATPSFIFISVLNFYISSNNSHF
jgi:hypothetical protein